MKLSNYPSEAVAKRYEKEGYIVMTEFAFGKHRIDIIALSPWEARSYGLHFFEVKSYRDDWIRELNNPDKQEGFFAMGGSYWLIETEKNIVKVEELPKGFGLMLFEAGKLKTIKEADYRKPVYDIDFLMAFLNKMRKYYNEDKLSNQYQRGKEAGEKGSAQAIAELKERVKEMEDKVQRFEELTGVSIWYYDEIENEAEVFKTLKSLKTDSHLEGIIEDIDRQIRRLEESKKVLEGAK